MPWVYRWPAALLLATLVVAGCSGEENSGGGRRSAAPPAATRGAAVTPTPTPTARSVVQAPPIRDRLIPFGEARRREMAAYSLRHYGDATYRLARPRVIVEHYTATTTAEAAWNTFARDVPDVELGELPQVCAHFLVDRDGTIYRLVPLGIRCRHTVGLNHTAIGVEHVGTSDAEVMRNDPQRRASHALSRWLRCRFGIRVRDVIGHSESLSSPYHRERATALRTQTHADMARATMLRYRAALARAGC
jgi:N-acetylmuramoyl-L-alanine amidase